MQESARKLKEKKKKKGEKAKRVKVVRELPAWTVTRNRCQDNTQVSFNAT